ncbi:MAG TPA: hypothetical protein VMT30_09350 [Candidatus Saccharimonadia bacterium]|nr:hypothetical protein [Candidatus Saccharimonadia bacterium]
MSDIAIWIYGDDGLHERSAVRIGLCRLRQSGYRIEQRAATWDWGARGRVLAYRLISEPEAGERRAA